MSTLALIAVQSLTAQATLENSQQIETELSFENPNPNPKAEINPRMALLVIFLCTSFVAVFITINFPAAFGFHFSALPDQFLIKRGLIKEQNSEKDKQPENDDWTTTYGIPNDLFKKKRQLKMRKMKQEWQEVTRKNFKFNKPQPSKEKTN